MVLICDRIIFQDKRELLIVDSNNYPICYEKESNLKSRRTFRFLLVMVPVFVCSTKISLRLFFPEDCIARIWRDFLNYRQGKNNKRAAMIAFRRVPPPARLSIPRNLPVTKGGIMAESLIGPPHRGCWASSGGGHSRHVRLHSLCHTGMRSFTKHILTAETLFQATNKPQI